jgi:D-tyrosyl-tRNA(Tyr) deacylase
VRVVIQRVSTASVTVDEKVMASIGPGLTVLVGIHGSDTESDVTWLAQKIVGLRIFADDSGKMNRSLLDFRSDSGASETSAAVRVATDRREVLVISQFTLFASTRKGQRPSFNAAAAPVLAIPLYEMFIRQLETLLGHHVATGSFGAMMQVALVNDGPVTLVIDSKLRE